MKLYRLLYLVAVALYGATATGAFGQQVPRQTCPDCNDMRGRCTVCYGSGRVTKVSMGGTEYVTCETCHGQGTCQTCGGSGWLDHNNKPSTPVAQPVITAQPEIPVANAKPAEPQPKPKDTPKSEQPSSPKPKEVATNGIDWNQSINQAPKTGKHADNTFALIIANEHYEVVAPVAMARNDGEAFKAYCQNTLGLDEKHIKYYTDATYGKMSRGFKEIREIARAYDGDINLIVYYAGHGIPDNATKDAFILPVDADGSDMDVCISLNKMYKDIADMNVKQSVVFMDACFSGAQRGGNMIVAARGVAIKPKEAKPATKTIVFSATSDEEAAYPYEEQRHGLFTYFLLKKLQETQGDVSLGELADFISTNVRRNSIVVNGKKQTPTVSVSEAMGDAWKGFRLAR
ncbi:MAG: caspase family protein [Alloprevotella sp.]|nr:caspase family protein [Alloprevotella sp.]